MLKSALLSCDLWPLSLSFSSSLQVRRSRPPWWHSFQQVLAYPLLIFGPSHTATRCIIVSAILVSPLPRMCANISLGLPQHEQNFPSEAGLPRMNLGFHNFEVVGNTIIADSFCQLCSYSKGLESQSNIFPIIIKILQQKGHCMICISQ